MAGPPDLVSRLRSIVAVVVRLLARYLKWVSIVFVPLYAGIFIASETTPWIGLATWFLMLLVALASVGLREYPITTVGTAQRVDEALFTDEREHCAECGLSIDRGQYRRYAKQYVAFGYPLYTTDWGQNAYCPCCAEGLESPATDAADSRDAQHPSAQPAGELATTELQ